MLTLAIRPSATLLAILLVAHGSAIAIVAVSDVPAIVQFSAGMILALSLVFTVRRHVLLRSPRSVVALEISSDNVLSAELRGGEWVECEVRGDTYVSSFLTVLNLRRRDTRKAVNVTLLPDMADAEGFRKLRTWLRWQPKAGSSGDSR